MLRDPGNHGDQTASPIKGLIGSGPAMAEATSASWLGQSVNITPLQVVVSRV